MNNLVDIYSKIVVLGKKRERERERERDRERERVFSGAFWFLSIETFFYSPEYSSNSFLVLGHSLISRIFYLSSMEWFNIHWEYGKILSEA